MFGTQSHSLRVRVVAKTLVSFFCVPPSVFSSVRTYQRASYCTDVREVLYWGGSMKNRREIPNLVEFGQKRQSIY
jgi:hypothetical protein